jgi:hypothetical protein
LTAAVAVELSVGLLLYADEGLLPALTLILTVEIGALGLGLWTGSIPLFGGVVEQVRRRWLFCLVVFALAAAFSGVMGLLGDLPVTGLAQGLGLGFLGGLPLFSIGALLGAMRNRGEPGSGPAVVLGAPAVLGAAAGFWLAGIVLIPSVAPYSVYLFCLVLLSGGALLHGWVLDHFPVVDLLETRMGSLGQLRVERRASGGPRRQIKVLLEAGRVRGGEDEVGHPVRRWEAAVLAMWKALPRPPDSLLYLGGGSGTLVRELSNLIPLSRRHVVEWSPELVSLAQDHLQEWEGWKDLPLTCGNLLDPADESIGRFEAVIVDCDALPTLGGAPYLGETGWRSVGEFTQRGGTIILGGLRSGAEIPQGALGEFLNEGRWRFPQARLYREPLSPGGRELLGREMERTDSFLVLSTSDLVFWPPSVLDFRHVLLEEG